MHGYNWPINCTRTRIFERFHDSQEGILVWLHTAPSRQFLQRAAATSTCYPRSQAAAHKRRRRRIRRLQLLWIGRLGQAVLGVVDGVELVRDSVRVQCRC